MKGLNLLYLRQHGKGKDMGNGKGLEYMSARFRDVPCVVLGNCPVQQVTSSGTAYMLSTAVTNCRSGKLPCTLRYKGPSRGPFKKVD